MNLILLILFINWFSEVIINTISFSSDCLNRESIHIRSLIVSSLFSGSVTTTHSPLHSTPIPTPTIQVSTTSTPTLTPITSTPDQITIQPTHSSPPIGPTTQLPKKQRKQPFGMENDMIG